MHGAITERPRCRRYDHKEVGGRVAPGAATENNVRNTTPGKEELE